MSAVYFAQVGRYIKVGCSDDPERRVRRLFSSDTRYCRPEDCPTDLASRRLLMTIPGWTNEEARCHRALDDYRVVGEFFIDEPGVRDFMARAAAGDFAPVQCPDGPYCDGNEQRNLTPDFRETVDRLFDPTPEARANLAAMIARHERRRQVRAA